MDYPTTAFIGMGSNLGDGVKILRAAWEDLGRRGGVQLGALSHPYRTAPVDMESSYWFTNAVGRVQTSLTAMDLMNRLLEVEAVFGRNREGSGQGYRDRSLDLDLLCFNGLVLDTPTLVLPHPRMAARLFVLLPFSEIAPDFKERQDVESVSERCADMITQMAAGVLPGQEVKKIQWED